MAWVVGIAVCLVAFGAVAWMRAAGRLGHTPAHLVDACLPGRIGGVGLERGAAIHWSRSATVRIEGRTLEVRLSATERGARVTLEGRLDPEVAFNIIGADLAGSQARPGPTAFLLPLLGPYPVECPPGFEAQVREALDAQTCKALRGPLARGVSVLGRAVRLSTFVPRPSLMLNREELEEAVQGKLHYEAWARDLLAAAAVVHALALRGVVAVSAALEPGLPPAPGLEGTVAEDSVPELPPDLPVKCALCGFENEPGSQKCRQCGRSLDTRVQRRFTRAVLEKKERMAGQLSDSLDREVREEAFRERHGAELRHLEQRLIEEGEKARAERAASVATRSALTNGLLLAGGLGGVHLHGLVGLVRLATSMKRSTALVMLGAVGLGAVVAGLAGELGEEVWAILLGFFGLLGLLGLAFGRKGSELNRSKTKDF